MIKILVLLGCFTLTFAAQVYRFEQTIDSDPFETQWTFFKHKHGKNYKTADEELNRKEIFRNNVRKIEQHNALHAQGFKTYTLGINEYADMEPEEFVAQMNGFVASDTRKGSTYMSPLSMGAIPDEVDWRTKGLVTEVKNQGACGSCWSFSATGSLEGQHMKKTGKLVSLSEQNLVDCSKAQGNNGCQGGLMDQAFTYIKINNGIDTEASYPYEAQNGACRFKPENVGATDTGFVDIPRGNETALKEAVATIGPISVAIDAGHSSYQLYKSGVYSELECSQTKLDHGVLVVGFGTTDNTDFWLVKNSWGSTWGMEGYIMMSRNKDNQCGIATQASYPLV